MTKEQAVIDDIGLIPSETSAPNTKQTTQSIYGEQVATNLTRSSTVIHWCLENLPKAPFGFQFSLRQQAEQYEFFQYRLDLYSSRFLDLYNAAIIIASKLFDETPFNPCILY